ncbi:MAG TPA: ubiquinol-cytochrome C chaperone family protein [Bradyrhizobium sp.]|jgi:cytochrome b pre-mRNA-processing protein 3|uniref:ubiquinol-cytochrome C chaperone family protein n=1 Tax=Bradyrhizobium sp. TaxID=376 RepID=UPI002B46D7E1|nr:ubiquinol-cytochrome C chaperone family protein [Bradyrhizobium sp.]HKO73612.1 ubiquinol-cytochrome C chaperone family protein [Bradyrhizobium sp.]
MVWPFDHFRKPPLQVRRTIETIYGMIVTQAREPLFYRELGVADTVDGRFDVLVLHLWVVLRRLKTMENGVVLSQGLFDRFCEDMDGNLREMGVSDLKVPKRMQAFGEAFYGRSVAYDVAVAEGQEALAVALRKNVLDSGQIENARRLASYTEAAISALTRLDDANIQSGSWRFPAPARAGV